MKITLLTNDKSPNRRCKLPFPDADHAVAERDCPKCGTHDFKVAGSGRRASADDRAWESDAYCLACRTHVGVLRCETNTLFGVREDERVLAGRVRIY